MYYLKCILGILSGSKAFTGPHTASIHLTNKCNQTCIFCSTYSPYRQHLIHQDKKRYESNFEDVRRLVDNLSVLGTKKIILSGGGEPFLYPYIFEVIRYIKEKRMRCAAITNGTIFKDEDIHRLLISGIDEILVSVCAGDEGVGFVKTIFKAF